MQSPIFRVTNPPDASSKNLKSRMQQQLVRSFHEIKYNLHQQKWFHDLADALLLLLILQMANVLFRFLCRTPLRSPEKMMPTGEQPSTAVSSLEGQTWTIAQGNGRLPVVLNLASGSLEDCLQQLQPLQISTEGEVVNILVKCCSQERGFFPNYGAVSAHLCQSHSRWEFAFSNQFHRSYSKESKKPRKVRNTALLFAHLLCTDSISWVVFQQIRFNDYETSASSRLFLKTILLALAKHLGVEGLKDRIRESQAFTGIFPTTKNLRHARYAIQFLTFLNSIGLKPLTVELREMVHAQKSKSNLRTMEDEISSSEASSMNSSSIHSLNDNNNMQNASKTDSLRSERSYSSRGSSRTSYSGLFSTHRRLSRQSFSPMDSPLILPRSLRVSLDGSQESHSSTTNEKDINTALSQLVQPPLSPRKDTRSAIVLDEAEGEDEILQSPLLNNREDHLSVMELLPRPLLLPEDAEYSTDEVDQNAKISTISETYIHCKVIE
jgi:hypothetical protein